MLSVQPHPGGLIGQAVVIESAAALRAKVNMGVGRIYMPDSHSAAASLGK